MSQTPWSGPALDAIPRCSIALAELLRARMSDHPGSAMARRPAWKAPAYIDQPDLMVHRHRPHVRVLQLD